MTTIPTTSNINARQNKHHNPKILSSNLLHISPKYRAPNKGPPSWPNQQSTPAPHWVTLGSNTSHLRDLVPFIAEVKSAI